MKAFVAPPFFCSVDRDGLLSGILFIIGLSLSFANGERGEIFLEMN